MKPNVKPNKELKTISDKGKTSMVLVLKVCLVVFSIFIFGTSQGQRITAEHQLKMLELDYSSLSNTYKDSLIITPSKSEFNLKTFLNDTINKPINTTEITTIYVEAKTIMLTNINNTFLFQIKKKSVEDNNEGIIEHYYCTKGNNLYLITLVKDGVYIRKNNSYYSSFFNSEEFK
jgi:hypothetical protein